MSGSPQPRNSQLPDRTLRKGDQGADVAQMYAYLKRFGYFPNAQVRTGNLLHRPAVPFVPEDVTRYDDLMETAVRRFQRQQGLTVTGALDGDTLALMHRPRCGFPDEAVAGVDLFVAQGNRWPGNEVTYSFDNYSPDLDRAQQRAAVIGSFDRWAVQIPLTFREVPSNGDIRIGWYAGEHGDGFAFTGPGGVLAHCFYPPPNGGVIAGDCHFDEAETWSVNLPPSGIDLPTVALHELGHGLGLAHSAIPSSVMYAYYGGPRRELTQDDIDGIRFIYGTRLTWASLGGTIATPAVGRNADGRLEVFARHTDGALHHRWQVAPNGTWSGWHSLGGWCRDPAVGTNADGRLEVFVTGSDGALFHKWQVAPNGGWSDWHSLGGWCRRPAVDANADGRLEVFATGSDGALHHKWQVAPNGGWSDWHSLGGVMAGPVAVAANADGRLEVFVRGTDAALYHRWQLTPNGAWGNWTSLGGWAEDPTVVRNADGRLEVFVTGSDHGLYHAWQVAPNGGWSGWAQLGGWVAEPYATANADGRLEVFVRGSDNAVHHIWQTSPGGSWSGWSSLGHAVLEGPVAGRNRDGRLEVFVKGTDQALWHIWQRSPGGGWG